MYNYFKDDLEIGSDKCNVNTLSKKTYKIMNIEFKKIDLSNIDEYGKLSNPDKKFNEFDGPYFKHDNVAEHFKRIEDLRKRLKNNEEVNARMRLIYSDGKLLGSCSWYWKSKETNWLEVGINIFEETNWNKGIGTKALAKWIDYVFETHPEIVRIGLGTWSGNLRMIAVSKKLGLKQEACFRKARIVNNKYYDAVNFGILREEWFNLSVQK